MADRRRTFGPAVLAGLAGAGLEAMAGNEAWRSRGSTTFADSPATTALALALLAAWGVLLVTRGRFRRVVSALAALLALGVAATVVYFPFDTAPSSGDLQGWYWAAVVGLPLVVVPAVLSVRLVPSWPEMGRKYDAPADAAPEPALPPEERDNIDLWKSIDEGRDPTA